ncbi:MAG: F0F1 ATP synthase subunit B [Mycobacterium sp.]
MGDVSATVLAAEEGGTSNFLIPNGTFFFVLIIFLIVLGVIGKFVVPSIVKVLGEREEMVTKTGKDNRKAAELEAAADSDYDREMAAARTEASGIRDEARAQGRKVLDDMRGRANGEVEAALQRAANELKQQSDSIAVDLRSSVETLSSTLASRVIGVSVSSSSTSAGR